MQNNSSKSRYMADINVTPLVDIVLVLLIIFMATAPLISHRQIGVNVPEAAQAEQNATETVEIRYTEDKKIYLGGALVNEEELRLLLKQRLKQDPGAHVCLVADRVNSYGDVIGILDLAKGAGVKKLALEVKTKRT